MRTCQRIRPRRRFRSGPARRRSMDAWSPTYQPADRFECLPRRTAILQSCQLHRVRSAPAALGHHSNAIAHEPHKRMAGPSIRRCSHNVAHISPAAGYAPSAPHHPGLRPSVVQARHHPLASPRRHRRGCPLHRRQYIAAFRTYGSQHGRVRRQSPRQGPDAPVGTSSPACHSRYRNIFPARRQSGQKCEAKTGKSDRNAGEDGMRDRTLINQTDVQASDPFVPWPTVLGPRPGLKEININEHASWLFFWLY